MRLPLPYKVGFMRVYALTIQYAKVIDIYGGVLKISMYVKKRLPNV